MKHLPAALLSACLLMLTACGQPASGPNTSADSSLPQGVVSVPIVPDEQVPDAVCT